jgi:tripartite-type tricarboxylate transporter receptor subunit TctC
VVTTAAGATNDTIARMYAPRLSEQLKQRMIELGAEPVEKSQDESAAFIDLQVEKWAKVILESGAKADD